VRLLAAVTLLCALALAACGNDRTEVAETRAGGDEPVKHHEFPRYGIEVAVPQSVFLDRRARPEVFRLFLGQPVISMFAYRRRERIPHRPRELAAARRRLIREVKGRDPRFKLRSARLTEVANARAVELVGDQTISRGHLRTRSLHVYKGKAEYVIELLAPVADFARTDREVFRPLLRSLTLSGDVKRAAGRE
jgi:hypothetical protein